MNPSRLIPQPALTSDETLAADRLMAELLLEFTGDTVVGLDAHQAEGPVADGTREIASRRATA